jgi:lysophospholipase L1-like esterase
VRRTIIKKFRAVVSQRRNAGQPLTSREPRAALNSAVAGRRWNGQLFQPTPHANAKAWGFGFIPPEAELDSLAFPLGRHCFGQKIRIRIWRCRSLRPGDPFRAPGRRGDRLIFDRVLTAVAAVEGEPIAQFCRVDLSGVPRWEACLHLVEWQFAEEPQSPLAVGRASADGPWTWECGWVHLRHREPMMLERPWGLAWALYGKDKERSWRCHGGDVEVHGRAETEGFRLSLPKIAISQTAHTAVSEPTEFQIAEPSFRQSSVHLPTPAGRVLLPFRHIDLLNVRGQATVRHQGPEIHWQGGQGEVDYRGWTSRYDLVSIHRQSGRLALTLGAERELDPEEFPAAAPPEHIALYSLYTTRHGVEAIPVHDWRAMVRNDRRADHQWWLESSRQALRPVFSKLRRGGTFRLVGYGDSLTSLGGRDPTMVEAPNGAFRDNMGYFERYGDDWKSSVELFDAADGKGRCHQRLGWNWYLKAAMEAAYDVEVDYLNWGIPGTTTERGRKNIEGLWYPNGSEPMRLERLLASKPDLVTVSFGMNEIGDPVDTYGNMRRICDIIRGGGAEVLVIGLCQQNAGFGSRDHSLWRLTHDQIANAAADCGAPYVPTWEIFGDGNEGATGLSRCSHSAASMTNHPGPRELAAVGQYMAKIII